MNLRQWKSPKLKHKDKRVLKKRNQRRTAHSCETVSNSLTGTVLNKSPKRNKQPRAKELEKKKSSQKFNINERQQTTVPKKSESPLKTVSFTVTWN